MKVDFIVKNADVFTSEKRNLKATAFAVKDGKFVYVGDESGLSQYEGEVIDLGGKFVTPAFMDSHCHITLGVSSDYNSDQKFISGNSKKECLDKIAKEIKANPGNERYKFLMRISDLQGEYLCKEELDQICADSEIIILENEGHSAWVNSIVLEHYGITDETKDIVSELSYFDVDDDGHKTGYIVEMTAESVFAEDYKKINDEQIEKSLTRFFEFAKKKGISAVFDAGIPINTHFQDSVFDVLKKMDEEGKVPIHIEGCYMISAPDEFEGAIDKLKEYKKKYDSPHIRFNTMKILYDGTFNIRTACMIRPYKDTGGVGGRVVDVRELGKFIENVQKAEFDLHIHTVGEGAVNSVLSSIIYMKEILRSSLKVQVTCAHNELIQDEDIEGFKKLGVIANFTPWWNSGCCISGGHDEAVKFLGEDRANKMYRCRTIWDTGATVCWSSDNISFDNFKEWNPLLGMEVGITRAMSDKTDVEEYAFAKGPYPAEEECMTMEQMLLGYTINNAKQMRLQKTKGSIAEDKDADFLVFEKSLFDVDPHDLTHLEPEVYFGGEKQ